MTVYKTYKCLSGLAPAYLVDDCVLVSSVTSRRHLRSAEARKLVIRRTRTVVGARDCVVSNAVVWNSLPADLRVSSLAVATFARHSSVFLRELAHLVAALARCGLLLQTVCGLSVCRSVTTVSPAKAAEPIMMPFQMWAQVGQGTTC